MRFQWICDGNIKQYYDDFVDNVGYFECSHCKQTSSLIGGYLRIKHLDNCKNNQKRAVKEVLKDACINDWLTSEEITEISNAAKESAERLKKAFPSPASPAIVKNAKFTEEQFNALIECIRAEAAFVGAGAMNHPNIRWYIQQRCDTVTKLKSLLVC